ncbi:MAG TPA: universal stress protein [Anaerolineaceae bacterium]|nr:universal stress protein [Anaerolineaceae bacterium]
MIERYDLLICLQGIAESRQALDYGLYLAEILRRPTTLLGVGGRAPTPEGIDAQIEEGVERLSRLGLPYDVQRMAGPLAQAVPFMTRAKPYMTIYNAPPLEFWRRLAEGGRFRRLLVDAEGPILRVRNVCRPLTHALVCSGGLSYADPLERIGAELARAAGARLTLLHVVPRVTLDYPLAQRLAHDWQHLLETDTPQARHLTAALAQAQELGVETELRVRHGPVVDEILDEVNSGDYDLVGLGSPYASHNLRHLYRPNVTASVAEEVACPVLTVH